MVAQWLVRSLEKSFGDSPIHLFQKKFSKKRKKSVLWITLRRRVGLNLLSKVLTRRSYPKKITGFLDWALDMRFVGLSGLDLGLDFGFFKFSG